MDLQDVNANSQNTCTVPKIGEDGKCIQDETCRTTVSEAKPSLDLHGDGKVDTPSVHMVGNDPNFANTVLPPRTTRHGIFNFLVLIFSLRSVSHFYRSYILLKIVFVGYINC